MHACQYSAKIKLFSLAFQKCSWNQGCHVCLLDSVLFGTCLPINLEKDNQNFSFSVLFFLVKLVYVFIHCEPLWQNFQTRIQYQPLQLYLFNYIYPSTFPCVR